MKQILIILLAAATLSSCATAKFYSGFKPEAASGEMALLGPVSTQFYIDSNDKVFYSDSLSAVSENLLADLSVRMGVPVNEIFQLDSLEKEEAVGFMHYLSGKSKKAIGEAPIPTALDELLEAEGYRYGLLLFADGMTRDKSGYVKDAIKGAALGVIVAIATLGSVIPYNVPEACSSGVYAAILDSRTDRVAFYNICGPDEVNPLLENPVRSQLARLLRNFLS